ncbi:hypothetical protein JCM4814A_94140 [Streptomyces phaeofaciens JCM 4814]|uniref:Uncharacterized protein n=1 Tax=Streptomyces phaeofaciens TaxID=68254 RepID=A0A918HR56_9ACTN|nr:hypothetical protein [Streptomyces phaeofaciens]GGT99047.1 hypothetical protein GCM10010226_90320 [Streptomyces phaeofaciens]
MNPHQPAEDTNPPTAGPAARTPAGDTAQMSGTVAVPAQRNATTNQDVRPAPSAHPCPASRPTMPARVSRWHRTTRRVRVLAARSRAIAWKLVKLSGEEFVKGFANKAGGIVALILAVLAIAYLLGIDPAEAVRTVLGM